MTCCLLANNLKFMLTAKKWTVWGRQQGSRKHFRISAAAQTWTRSLQLGSIWHCGPGTSLLEGLSAPIAKENSFSQPHSTSASNFPLNGWRPRMYAAVTAGLQPQSYTQASSPEWSSCLPALIPVCASCLHLPALTGNRPPARGQWRPGKLARLVPISWYRCLQNSLHDWRKGPCPTPQSGFSFFMAFIKFLWLLLS